MLFLDIGGKEVEINSDRCQATVSQDLLQAEDVTAVHQVVPGKGMPVGMRRTPCAGDTGFLAVAPQYLLDTISSKGQPLVI